MNLPIVSFEDWNAMTEQEQETYKASHYRFGVGIPDTSGVINAEYMTLLWENPNTTTSFASQTITLNSADYDFLLWTFNYAKAGTQGVASALIVPKGSNVWASDTYNASSAGVFGYHRGATYVSNTSYSVDSAYMAYGTTTTTNNDYLIPLAVYGIKKDFQFKVNAIATELSTRADHCFMDDEVTTVEDAITYKDVYSTDEHVVGKWIDGSILYEKTVDCGVLPNATSKNVAHGISNLGIVIEANGMAINPNNKVFTSLMKSSPSTMAQQFSFQIDATNITIETSSNQSTYFTQSHITIRYTKTS